MDEEISKKERIKLKHEQERARQDQEEKSKGFLLWGIGIVVLVIIAVFAWFLFQKTTEPPAPKPGKELADLGQDHVVDIKGVKYNSNPPTSGPHFDVWAKRGVYDYVISDGHLIHSLEHGYVILSYNCATEEESKEFISATTGLFQLATLTAESKMSFFTPDNPPKSEIELPASFASNDCKELAKQLSIFLKEFDRVIVVPRPQMENKITLTAWGRIEAMEEFDEDRTRVFIEAFHNAGPEKTVE